MAELQELSSCQLDDLPNEVILKSFGFLDIKELFLCGQVCKRLRAISNDESLWLKLNLLGTKISYDFIKKATENGCQYLSLTFDILHMTEKSESLFKLKYLNMSEGLPHSSGLTKLLQNCSLLQKLSVADFPLDSDDVKHICQNGQTLQVLDIGGCNIEFQNRTKLLQDLFTNCAHLTELNICADYGTRYLLVPQIQVLVDKMTPTILKLDLAFQNFTDEHVKTLVKRCNKITHLDLTCTLITNDSVQSIIKHLNTSLEKLNVSMTEVDSAIVPELKSITILKTLICDADVVDIENLKQHLRHINLEALWATGDLSTYSSSELKVGWEAYGCPFTNPRTKKQTIPHIRISGVENLHNTSPFRIMNGSRVYYDLIWELRAKQQYLFAKV